jgi:type 1 fimbria pilin
MLTQSVSKDLTMKKHMAVFSVLMMSFMTFSAFAKCNPVRDIGTPGDDRHGGVPLIFGTIKLQPTEFMPTGLISATNVSVGQAQAFQSGKNVNGPDTLLYICDITDAGKTFENFATNGDESTGGYNGNSDGVYQTYFPYTGIKLIRDKDGKVFSRYWQQSPISGHRVGNKLYFYARDFSSITAELYRLPATMRGKASANWSHCNGPAPDNSSGIGYTCTQPNGYTVFVGPGWNDDQNIKPGTDSNTNWGGFSNSNWIAFGMQYSPANTFAQTLWGCRVLSYTNPVVLPTITVSEVKTLTDKGKDFEITYRCGGPLINSYINKTAGVGPDKISIAFRGNKFPPETQAAQWSPFIVSDNYGQDGYASNVGIALRSSSDKLIGFINNAYTNDYSLGWISPLDGEIRRQQNDLSQVDITSQYYAFYSIIDQTKPVKPGKVDATAYIVVRYW